MQLEHLISEFGPLAVFIGSAVEGETAAFLGGVFAHRHLMAYWQAALAAILGSFIADQAFFFAGRYASQWRFVQTFVASGALSRVTTLLETYPTGFILAFRFIYGMRTISPVAIGLSTVSAKRFLVLNLIAAIVWGVVITAVGYLFGNAVEVLFGGLQLHLHLLIAIAVIIVLAVATTLVTRKYLLKSGSTDVTD